jgi:predicted nucleic acid-binding protein
MNDRYFLDSNVCIYLLEKGSTKQNIALELVTKQKPVISTQVIAENINVCLKKLRFSKENTFQHAQNLLNMGELVLIDEMIIQKAFDISLRYGFGYYDSLIVASALLNDCKILYSEDMHHQQIIEGTLQILNPFLV